MSTIDEELAAPEAAEKAATVAWVPGYEVTAQGRVFSVASNWRGKGRRELSQDSDRDGYRIVRVLIEGRRRKMRVHRLVLEAFVGPRPAFGEARHLNGVRHDNRISNLRWGTAAENAADRDNHGTTATGARNGVRTHPERVARGSRNGTQTHPERIARGERCARAKLKDADVGGRGYPYASASVRRSSDAHSADHGREDMDSSAVDAALAELERLSEAATPGVWEVHLGGADIGASPAIGAVYAGDACFICSSRGSQAHDDSRFIAAARNALPNLIAEVRLLRRYLENKPPFCPCEEEGPRQHANDCWLRPDRKLGEP